MQHYSKLLVWQRSNRLMLKLYGASQSFPSSERFGLTSQLRRAASSVPSNIAEGSKRTSAKDYAHFLNIAEGSLSETEYLILLSRDLECISADLARAYIAEASERLRMLHRLRERVRTDNQLNKSKQTVNC
jgi:four helix bundle protein